ncbi:MAG: GDP-L-fucose synthase [Candidatus Woesearchaeota archaeon]|nr:GDP-L-fucose synthase [Candidatus Woesearchaeota archaeon]
MKKIIVTGGAGFLGSNLCRYLLEKGDYVICVDDLSSGSESNIKLEHDNFKFISHNIIKPLEFEGEVDQIYHLASRASPPDYQSAPIHTMLTNAIGTNNLLKLALDKNAVFLYTSTSEVYGDPKVHPQTEDYWGNVNPTGIRSCYDESKRFGEALCMSYYRKHNANIKIVRIFNTYGPFMQKNDGRVVSNFINQALLKKPITIYGDGKQTRSFCYVNDLISGIFLLMNSKHMGPVNLGNPKEVTVLELANKIQELIGSKSEFVFKDLPKDDPLRRQPDISLAKEKLGWEPEISLEDGLRKTIDYFKNS